MSYSGSTESRYVAALSTLLLSPPESASFQRELRYVLDLNDDELRQLLDLSEDHHVTVRAINALEKGAAATGQDDLARRLDAPLAIEHKRIDNALRFLNAICHHLESSGCPVTVIKSLDHWPDLGGDLDLYTSGDRDEVIRVFTQDFAARLQPQAGAIVWPTSGISRFPGCPNWWSAT